MIRTLLAMTIGVVTAAAAGAETFRVRLSGASEVVTEGDADGAGVAFVTVDATAVSYYLWAKGIEAPTAAHIHSGRAAENGGVMVDLAPAFASHAAGAWVAAGSVTVDAAVATALAGNPGAYYVNIHTGPFPGGAIRGQLLGSGASGDAVATSLNGARAVGAAGDPDGSGFAGLVFDGDAVYYYARVTDVAAPTAAHVHRGRAGENGPVVIGFTADPLLTDGVIVGSVATSAALAGEILADPTAFYVNVHNADFPAGAVRGQLGSTETALHFPVAARNKGAGTSLFKTDVRVMSFADEDATVWAEWYPKNTAGLAGAAMATAVSVAKGGEAVLDDAAGTLFGATDRGAIRLVSLTPFLAVGNTYNDQRAAGLGTYGQFTEALPLDRAPRSGALLLGSNRPKADLVEFRTNLGYFNPNPTAVEVTFRVAMPDGAAVGTPTTRTFPPFSNDLLLYHQIITGVPVSQRSQANFLVTYTASAPVFIFSSLVDNVTDDGLHQPALPAPPPPPTPAPNRPPDAAIIQPAGDATTRENGTVIFQGSASDPDGDTVSVLWSFGDGGTSTALAPGEHVYAAVGTYTVTLTATDARGAVDPTPATLTVTVGPNAAPDGTIVAPAADIAVAVGQAVQFEGAFSDPDDEHFSVEWSFGDGVSSGALATSHTYLTPGTYTVTFTVIDSLGKPDPTPATRIVTVVQAVTFTQLQEDVFTETCSGCHPPNGGLDLRASQAYGSLVNVPSSQQPALMRVKAGDPAASYLVRKLEGGPTISGSRMPQGGPFLSPSQIQRIKDWIIVGAPNN
jgi:chitodextrinase